MKIKVNKNKPDRLVISFRENDVNMCGDLKLFNETVLKDTDDKLYNFINMLIEAHEKNKNDN